MYYEDITSSKHDKTPSVHLLGATTLSYLATWKMRSCQQDDERIDVECRGFGSSTRSPQPQMISNRRLQSTTRHGDISSRPAVISPRPQPASHNITSYSFDSFEAIPSHPIIPSFVQVTPSCLSLHTTTITATYSTILHT